MKKLLLGLSAFGLYAAPILYVESKQDDNPVVMESRSLDNETRNIFDEVDALTLRTETLEKEVLDLWNELGKKPTFELIYFDCFFSGSNWDRTNHYKTKVHSGGTYHITDYNLYASSYSDGGYVEYDNIITSTFGNEVDLMESIEMNSSEYCFYV